jgi:hypothetical protein
MNGAAPTLGGADAVQPDGVGATVRLMVNGTTDSAYPTARLTRSDTLGSRRILHVRFTPWRRGHRPRSEMRHIQTSENQKLGASPSP